MTSESTITGPTDERDDPADGRSGLYGWDWSATTHDGRRGIVDDLLDSLGAVLALPGKGLQGWSQSVAGYDRDGFLLGRIYYGGGRDDVHVLSTSEVADRARESVRGMDRCRTSRVDTRVDTLVRFEELAALLDRASERYRSQVIYYESFTGGKVAGEPGGRTVYLGAPTSAVRVRLYEKWLESPGQYVEGTNRVEVQLRPPSKAKEKVSGWSAAETFCASRVTRDLAEALGDDLAPKASLHVKRGTPDLERALAAMGDQYRGTVQRWLEVSGGDLGKVHEYLLPGPEPEAV